MKKILLLSLIVLTLFSCNTVPVDTKAETSHRIVGKEHNVYGGYGYLIIEIDGVEYVSASSGLFFFS